MFGTCPRGELYQPGRTVRPPLQRAPGSAGPGVDPQLSGVPVRLEAGRAQLDRYPSCPPCASSRASPSARTGTVPRSCSPRSRPASCLLFPSPRRPSGSSATSGAPSTALSGPLPRQRQPRRDTRPVPAGSGHPPVRADDRTFVRPPRPIRETHLRVATPVLGLPPWIHRGHRNVRAGRRSSTA